MKFIAFILLVLFSSLVYSQDSPFQDEDSRGFLISFTASLKAVNNITLSRSFETRTINTLPGYALGLEYYIIRDGADRTGGVGTEYQFNNPVYGLNGSFQNFPVYLFYDVSLMRIKYIALPNFHMQIGYNFLKINSGFPGENAKSGNGLYYGVGVSAVLTKFIAVRLLYSVSQGKIDYMEGSYLFSNNKISLTLVIR